MPVIRVSPRHLVLIALAIAGAVTFQQLVLGNTPANFLTFRAAHFRFEAMADLYSIYPEFNDEFKYSPAFALAFGAFSHVPSAIGLFLWNGLNAFVFLFALYRVIPRDRLPAGLLIVSLELFGSLQNAQSNPLVAALILLAVFEGGVGAGALLAGGAAIKLFPAVAICATRPRWKSVVAFLAVLLLLTLIPLVAEPGSALIGQYRSWWAILRGEGAVHHGLSLLGVVAQFAPDFSNLPLQLLGAFSLAPLLFQPRIRRDVAAAAVLLFAVLFNHEAESPSYVIAMAGVAVWYCFAPATRARRVLAGFAFLLVSISTSDACPGPLRELAYTQSWKAIGLLPVYCLVIRDVWRVAPKPRIAVVPAQTQVEESALSAQAA